MNFQVKVTGQHNLDCSDKLYSKAFVALRKRKWPGTANVPSHFSLSESHAAICLEIGTTLISTLRGIAAAATGALISSIPL